jgi:nitroimidazol reductase NimA-like FMN-containing flavoprotein (pyridoxamine 5'-phosphate oxidase superfamily)
MRQDIEDLIRANDICVLATVSGRDPHCSLMSYVTDPDCREIYMVTQRSTKKYRNLKENPSVSLLIDSRTEDGKGRTKALTVTGSVQGAGDEDRAAAIRERLLARHPHLQAFIADRDAEILVVKIRSLQLLDGVTDAHYETVT